MASAPDTGTMLIGVFVADGFGDVSCTTGAIAGVLSGVMESASVAALIGGTVVGTGVLLSDVFAISA